jgi:hypothetical protein
MVNKCQNCKHYEKTMETFYNPCHGGNPGSTDYDYPVHWCGDKEIEQPRRRVKCFVPKDTSNIALCVKTDKLEKPK